MFSTALSHCQEVKSFFFLLTFFVYFFFFLCVLFMLRVLSPIYSYILCTTIYIHIHIYIVMMFHSLWFGPGRIPRDFRNRHALLTMHLWFLHKRLISDTHDTPWALAIQEELFAIFWDDTTCRVRQEGINELLVSKNVTQVQQYTWLHLTHYDHIYTELLNKPNERWQELQRLIARHILIDRQDIAKSKEYHQKRNHNNISVDQEQTNELLDDPNTLVASKLPSQLDRIAWYIDLQYQNIVLDWPDVDYRDGRVVWTNLPDFTNMTTIGKDGCPHLLPIQPVHDDDVVPEPWRRNITLKGQDYYWNTETDESSWERPTVS